MPELDRQRLQQALQLAEQAIGVSDPNPRVGCVIGRADGQVLGTGSTQQAGGPHAEVMALRAARAGAHDVRDMHGATAWVTLEPCSHHGRTPPCCDALIDAGIARVVVGVVDPAPEVAGAGVKRLRAAGIEVVMADDDIAHAARELNIGFFSRHQRGRPWVRSKIAASLDGVTALANGASQWITGEAARADGHTWRRRAGAIVTGIGTVLADDPRLDVRLAGNTHQPLRVVLDSRWCTPVAARLLAAPGSALIIGAKADTDKQTALEAAGAQTLVLPDTSSSRVSLAGLLDELARRQINEVHVEAGAVLQGAWLAHGLVDELLVYMAPTLLGSGRAMTTLGPLEALADGLQLTFEDAALIGPDLRIRARRVPPA